MQHTDEVEASLEQIAAVAGLELGNPTVPSVTPSPSDACLHPEPDVCSIMQGQRVLLPGELGAHLNTTTRLFR
ncbi:unnamed protein product [Boreogadus saida]